MFRWFRTICSPNSILLTTAVGGVRQDKRRKAAKRSVLAHSDPSFLAAVSAAYRILQNSWARHSLFFILDSIFFDCSRYYAVYILHSIFYILYSKLYRAILYSIFCILYFVFYILYSMFLYSLFYFLYSIFNTQNHVSNIPKFPCFDDSISNGMDTVTREGKIQNPFDSIRLIEMTISLKKKKTNTVF